jgi:hypothetical protein
MAMVEEEEEGVNSGFVLGDSFSRGARFIAFMQIAPR